jgi:hypothetical protein
MRRINKALAVAATAAVAAVMVSPAPAGAAAQVYISPTTQSGVASTNFIWGGGWVTTAGHHYKVVFSFGDGVSSTLTNTPSDSNSWTHTFITVSCAGQVYTQKLSVTDLTSGGTRSTTATTSVARGNFC